MGEKDVEDLSKGGQLITDTWISQGLRVKQKSPKLFYSNKQRSVKLWNAFPKLGHNSNQN